MNIIPLETLSIFIDNEHMTYRDPGPQYFRTLRSYARYVRERVGQPVKDVVKLQHLHTSGACAVSVLRGETQTSGLREVLAQEAPGYSVDVLEELCRVAGDDAHRRTVLLGFFTIHQHPDPVQMAGYLVMRIKNRILYTYDHSAEMPARSNKRYPLDDLQTVADSFFVADTDMPSCGRNSIYTCARNKGVRISVRNCEVDGVKGVRVRLQQDRSKS